MAGLQFLGDSGPLRPLPLGQRHDDLAGLQLLGHARFGEHFRGLALRWPREYYRYYYLSYQSSVRSRVFSCPACHWWALHESGIGFSATDHWVTRDDAVHWGKIKEFDVAAAALPVDALRRQLAARGASLPAWPPTALAPLVSSCFSEFFACAAIPVGGSGDDGIDVILLDAADPLLLEVRRSADPASGESVQVVTELARRSMAAGTMRWHRGQYGQPLSFPRSTEEGPPGHVHNGNGASHQAVRRCHLRRRAGANLDSHRAAVGNLSPVASENGVQGLSA